MIRVGRMRVHVMVRNLEVLVGMMMVVVVVGNMVCMQRRMVVKPKNIRWLPNQSSWLAMIRTSLLLSLVREFYFLRRVKDCLNGFPRQGSSVADAVAVAEVAGIPFVLRYAKYVAQFIGYKICMQPSGL